MEGTRGGQREEPGFFNQLKNRKMFESMLPETRTYNNNVPQIRGTEIFIGYSGNENCFTCEACKDTSEGAKEYFSDQDYFKIVLYRNLPKSEQAIVKNCLPTQQLSIFIF